MWKGYENYDHYFDPSQLEEFLDEVLSSGLEISRKGKIEYYNIPAAFDIETSSFYTEKEEKIANMYAWMIGVNGSVMLGRDWDDWEHVLRVISKTLDLDPAKRILIMYVHNLGYEFQFMRKRLNWYQDRVFAIKDRRPVYALSQLGIEFRCSYFLSNYALAYIGAKLLNTYKVEKKVGDLDYSKTRNRLTKLTDAEIGYCVNDVRVVMSYIQEKIETDGDITNIPLTNTGYVRRFCRDFCFTYGQNSRKAQLEYHALMKSLQITSECEYQQMREAFAGGFTHASSLYSTQVLSDVGSADRTSAYPFEMCASYFPMTRCTFIGEMDEDSYAFRQCLDRYCCLFEVEVDGLYSLVNYEHYLSISHCRNVSEDRVVDNGRVVDAEHLEFTCTELDWAIFSKVYGWESAKIHGMRIYDRGYLPKPLILSILNLYQSKTSLKGLVDKVVEYMVSKNMINASFGMMVTAIVRGEHGYENDEWVNELPDVQDQLNGYNRNFNRFLFYGWGVWVTAHARYNLWKAIFEFKKDYVYSDTDSVKGLNFDKHKAFFTLENIEVRNKLYAMCDHYHISYDLVEPLTKKGEPKLLGAWDIEEGYRTFKTIGAKRYIYEYESGELMMTVSGVNKKFAVPYLLYQYTGVQYKTPKWLEKFKLAYSPDPNQEEESKKALQEIIDLHNAGKLSYKLIFDRFNFMLYIPKEHTGKSTLTYIDDPTVALCTDYQGNTEIVSELSSVHMEPQSYLFSASAEYLNFLEGIYDASI